jgi:Fungalysin/Thermolysin Propeptide Motif
MSLLGALLQYSSKNTSPMLTVLPCAWTPFTSEVVGLTVIHAFFRQIINGIEVADGEITVNVLNGMVISYTGTKSMSVGVGPPLS